MHIYFATITDTEESDSNSFKTMKIKAKNIADAEAIARMHLNTNEELSEMYSRADFKASWPEQHKAMWHSEAITATTPASDNESALPQILWRL